jgi:hypothetical protein
MCHDGAHCLCPHHSLGGARRDHHRHHRDVAPDHDRYLEPRPLPHATTARATDDHRYRARDATSFPVGHHHLGSGDSCENPRLGIDPPPMGLRHGVLPSIQKGDEDGQRWET